MDRDLLSNYIYNRLIEEKESIKKQYNDSVHKIGHFWIDDVLPNEIAIKIAELFPSKEEMVLKKSLKENKYIAVQMNQYDSLLEEVTYAFQESRIVQLIAEICSINEPIPDELLYAGGLSMMGEKQFLQPHLDNSHDGKRDLWRVLNLLYYVTPDWEEDFGGNLEVWPDGLTNQPLTIWSKFNRLAVMATHNDSLHSVSPVVVNNERKCVSNYYFSKQPLKATDSFHVTSFRGRPDQKVLDKVLQVDNALRMGVRKVFKKGIVENPHIYKKEE